MGHRLFAVEGHCLLGRYVRKVFNIGPFNGKVVGWRYTRGEHQFRVVFSDNDVEDITEAEVLEGIDLFGASTESNDKDLIDEAEKNWKEKRKQVSEKLSISFISFILQMCRGNLKSIKIGVDECFQITCCLQNAPIVVSTVPSWKIKNFGTFILQVA
jgi:hypothetical protein